MKIQVLFDRDSDNKDLHTGWGVSFVVDKHILFDTGEKFEYIVDNAKILGIDLKAIDMIVISHEHWDHVNGLWGMLEMNKGIKVYGCPSFDEEFVKRVESLNGVFCAVENTVEIAANVHVVGGNRVVYKGKGLSEQILFIKTDKSAAVICGCCHPGIVNMVHKVSLLFEKNVDTVFGGLHMIDKDKRFTRYALTEMKMLVEKVYSSHCTGHDAQEILTEFYGDKSIVLKVGMEVDL